MASQNAPARAAKGYKGMAMEGLIATWYAKNTRGDESQRQWARKIAALVPSGGRLLEVAPGPGYLSIELARLGDYQIVGLDISQTFVEIAQENARAAGVKVDFRQGNVSAMPFEANTFDFIVCRSAFKNFSEPLQALNEIYRVLRRGGKALILDLRRDTEPAAIHRTVNEMGLTPVNRWITQWTFEHMLLKRAYTRDEMAALVAASSFHECEIPDKHLEMEIWLQK